MRYTPRSSSNAECARSRRKILRATLSYRHRWTLIWFFYCLSPFSEKRNASRRRTAAGYAFTFSRGNVPMHFVTRICVAVISRREACRQLHTFLDTLNAVRRVDEIRRFHSLDYSEKKTRILALMDQGRRLPSRRKM